MASISDVIHHPSIKLVSLWCPHPHASIRWVAVTEHLNPTPFLEGGELVLTTSCGSPKTEHQWEEYVERLNKAHVSALAFGVGPWQRQVPRELLTAAREHGLNLIEVPEATNFVRFCSTSWESSAKLDPSRVITKSPCDDHRPISTNNARQHGTCHCRRGHKRSRQSLTEQTYIIGDGAKLSGRSYY